MNGLDVSRTDYDAAYGGESLTSEPAGNFGGFELDLVLMLGVMTAVVRLAGLWMGA